MKFKLAMIWDLEIGENAMGKVQFEMYKYNIYRENIIKLLQAVALKLTLHIAVVFKTFSCRYLNLNFGDIRRVGRGRYQAHASKFASENQEGSDWNY